uniref:FAR1 domain-containing protein n=2 Tax=Chenopodium quinoa TaxID=63459 RepID=A0A803MT10_CHEQI
MEFDSVEDAWNFLLQYEGKMGFNVRKNYENRGKDGQVHDFVSEHNHVLHPPKTSHLLSSQRKISEIQAIDIELVDDSKIRPRAAHEFIGAHVGGSSNLGYTHQDHKNYLR